MRQMLLQNTTAILLQNATKVYYKMRQLLKIASTLSQNLMSNYFKMSSHYKMRYLLQIATVHSVKLIEYSFFAVSVVSSNPYVDPFPRIKISFFLLSTCTEELISAPKIITFFTSPLPLGNVKVP